MCGKKSFPADWPTLVSNNESGLSLQTGSKQTWEHLHVQRSSIQREFVTKISYNIFYREYLVRQREHWWGLQSSVYAQLLSAQYYCICRILGVCSYPHPHLALLANRLLNGGRKKEDKTSGEQLEDQWNLYSQIMEIFCVQETNSVVHLPLCSRTGSSSGSFQSSFKKSFVYRPKRHTQSTSN